MTKKIALSGASGQMGRVLRPALVTVTAPK